MPLRFFADHCVSNLVIETLRNTGHEVLRLKDHMPVESADLLVISKAQELDAILLSLNADFADIVAYPPEKFRGIVALQVRDHPEVVPALMRNLMDYLAARPTLGILTAGNCSSLSRAESASAASPPGSPSRTRSRLLGF